MITLYQFKSAWGLPNPSPFCFKVENYLRMTDVPFRTQIGDPRKAPKKKLPYIDDGGTLVADSEHIIEHLKKTRGDRLDAGLTAEQRALAHVVARTFDEAYYWCCVYARWIDGDAFDVMKRDVLLPGLPSLLRPFLPLLVQKQVAKMLYAQGTGRHAPSEIYAKAKADLDALSTLLADKPFILGDAPASVDATLYAFLAASLWAPPETGVLPRHVATKPNLVAYCERMRARYYGGPNPS
ncbi:MAG: glutathione S-transferase family protein [Polyangiaceae bacterium]|nr:glutathione S-transferase family protein [Polyangiaceae bacterium]